MPEGAPDGLGGRSLPMGFRREEVPQAVRRGPGRQIGIPGVALEPLVNRRWRDPQVIPLRPDAVAPFRRQEQRRTLRQLILPPPQVRLHFAPNLGTHLRDPRLVALA